MRITDILSTEALIAPQLVASTKAEVLAELAHHLAAQVEEVEEHRLVEVLWERERLGSTAIGDGIAIPHGKLPGLRGVVGMFGRHPGGVDFDSLDDGAVTIRDRDTTEQVRVPIESLVGELGARLGF